MSGEPVEVAPDEAVRTLLDLQKEGVYGQKHPLVVQAEQVG